MALPPHSLRQVGKSEEGFGGRRGEQAALELLFCCSHPINSLIIPSPQHGPRLPAQEDLLPGFLSVCGGQAREPGGLPLVLSQRCLSLCALTKGRD